MKVPSPGVLADSESAPCDFQFSLVPVLLLKSLLIFFFEGRGEVLEVGGEVLFPLHPQVPPLPSLMLQSQWCILSMGWWAPNTASTTQCHMLQLPTQEAWNMWQNPHRSQLSALHLTTDSPWLVPFLKMIIFPKIFNLYKINSWLFWCACEILFFCCFFF